MQPNSVKTFAPATVSNLGPGFDVLGIALERPGDIVVAEKQIEPGLQFSLADATHAVPTDEKNIAAHVARLMLEELKPPFGVAMTLHKKMPIGSGLGSSGASCAAAALAINALLAKPLAKKELIRFAVEGERLATGSAHADNVAPSLLGGLCLIRSYEPLDIIQLPVKNIYYWVVAHPHLIIETQIARDLLPKNVLLKTAVQQWGNLSGLIVGLMQGDNQLVSVSLQDVIAEPVRAPLIPGYNLVKQAAIAAGALGFSISGSGPSVFAITTSADIAQRVAQHIQNTFLTAAGIPCDMIISLMNLDGATILEQTP